MTVKGVFITDVVARLVNPDQTQINADNLPDAALQIREICSPPSPISDKVKIEALAELCLRLAAELETLKR